MIDEDIISEYNKAMGKFSDMLRVCPQDKFEELYEMVGHFQSVFMKAFVESMPAETEAQRAMKECFAYAAEDSISGSSIITGIDPSASDELEDLCAEYVDFADFEVYEEDGELTLDAVFYGNYVPYWDGWDEENNRYWREECI